jgi:hypothetical protein
MASQQSDVAESLSITEDDDPHMQNVYKPEANKYCPNNNPLVSFAGHQWWINYHWDPVNGIYADEPFKTIFDPYLINTPDSSLLLQILPPTDQYKTWRTSEAVLMDNLGYGHYLVTASTSATGGFSGLDSNAVFGVFTYQFTNTQDESPNIYREIDALEVLWRSQPGDAQFMLQPWDRRPPGKYFTIPANTPVITVVLNWHVESSGLKVASFGLWTGDYSFADINNIPPYQTLDATNSDFKDLIPSHRWERFHLNLWLMHGAAPKAPQQVSITRFQFQPYQP